MSNKHEHPDEKPKSKPHEEANEKEALIKKAATTTAEYATGSLFSKLLAASIGWFTGKKSAGDKANDELRMKLVTLAEKLHSEWSDKQRNYDDDFLLILTEMDFESSMKLCKFLGALSTPLNATGALQEYLVAAGVTNFNGLGTYARNDFVRDFVLYIKKDAPHKSLVDDAGRIQKAVNYLTEFIKQSEDYKVLVLQARGMVGLQQPEEKPWARFLNWTKEQDQRLAHSQLLADVEAATKRAHRRAKRAKAQLRGF